MENILYNQHYELEEKHWWFVGRRKIISALMSQLISEKLLPSALDIGCATGFNANMLRNFAENITGIEMSAEVARLAKKRTSQMKIIVGKFPEVEIEEKFDLITLFDVLEHIENDEFALRKISKLLNPNGYLILTVPAFSFLWGKLDKSAGHYRRYTKNTLYPLLDRSGFLVKRMTYFNTFLFPAIFAYRKMHNVIDIKKRGNDFTATPAFLNTPLSLLFGSERFFLRKLDFPFGVSLFVAAKKT